jgi:hypothetical protein
MEPYSRLILAALQGAVAEIGRRLALWLFRLCPIEENVAKAESAITAIRENTQTNAALNVLRMAVAFRDIRECEEDDS